MGGCLARKFCRWEGEEQTIDKFFKPIDDKCNLNTQLTEHFLAGKIKYLSGQCDKATVGNCTKADGFCLEPADASGTKCQYKFTTASPIQEMQDNCLLRAEGECPKANLCTWRLSPKEFDKRHPTRK